MPLWKHIYWIHSPHPNFLSFFIRMQSFLFYNASRQLLFILPTIATIRPIWFSFYECAQIALYFLKPEMLWMYPESWCKLHCFISFHLFTFCILLGVHNKINTCKGYTEICQLRSYAWFLILSWKRIIKTKMKCYCVLVCQTSD